MIAQTNLLRNANNENNRNRGGVELAMKPSTKKLRSLALHDDESENKFNIMGTIDDGNYNDEVLLSNRSDRPLNSDASLLHKVLPKGKEKKLNYEAINKNLTSHNKPIEELNEVEILEQDIYNNAHKLEDEYKTEELFIKLQFEEFISAFWAMFTICTSLIYYEVRENIQRNHSLKNETIQTLTANTAFNQTYITQKTAELNLAEINLTAFSERVILILLILSSISVAMFIFNSILRYIIYFEVQKSCKNFFYTETMSSTGTYIGLLVEIIIAIFHPNLLFHGFNKYVCDKDWNLESVSYNINDFMIVVTMARIYSAVRFILCLTRFYCARANRVAKMTGSVLDMTFALRCILIHKPVQMEIILTILSTFSLANMLKVIEGPVFLINEASRDNLIDYRSLANCFWNVLVTMTTVGYGDIYPKTTFGRFVTVITSLLGIVLVSLLIIGLQGAFKLEVYEQTVYDFVDRLVARTDTHKLASSYFIAGYKYSVSKKKFWKLKETGCTDKEIEDCKEELKQNLINKNKVKMEYRDALHNFRNAYEGPSNFDPIHNKIEELESTVETITTLNKNLLSKITKISEKLNTVDY